MAAVDHDHIKSAEFCYISAMCKGICDLIHDVFVHGCYIHTVYTRLCTWSVDDPVCVLGMGTGTAM